MTIICELICSPVGEGISVSKFVKVAIDALKGIKGLKTITHPMGTVYEVATLDQAFGVARIAHEAILSAGSSRVVTQLRIDDRRDIERTMQDKVDAVI